MGPVVIQTLSFNPRVWRDFRQYQREDIFYFKRSFISVGKKNLHPWILRKNIPKKIRIKKFNPSFQIFPISQKKIHIRNEQIQRRPYLKQKKIKIKKGH